MLPRPAKTQGMTTLGLSLGAVCGHSFTLALVLNTFAVPLSVFRPCPQAITHWLLGAVKSKRGPESEKVNARNTQTRG